MEINSEQLIDQAILAAKEQDKSLARKLLTQDVVGELFMIEPRLQN